MHPKLRSWISEFRCEILLRMRINRGMQRRGALWLVLQPHNPNQRKLHSDHFEQEPLQRRAFWLYRGSWKQDTSIVYLSSRSCVSIDRKSISFADNGAVQDPEAGLHDERAACLQARPQKGKRIKYPSKKRVHMHGS